MIIGAVDRGRRDRRHDRRHARRADRLLGRAAHRDAGALAAAAEESCRRPRAPPCRAPLRRSGSGRSALTSLPAPAAGLVVDRRPAQRGLGAPDRWRLVQQHGRRHHAPLADPGHGRDPCQPSRRSRALVRPAPRRRASAGRPPTTSLLHAVRLDRTRRAARTQRRSLAGRGTRRLCPVEHVDGLVRRHLNSTSRRSGSHGGNDGGYGGSSGSTGHSGGGGSTRGDSSANGRDSSGSTPADGASSGSGSSSGAAVPAAPAASTSAASGQAPPVAREDSRVRWVEWVGEQHDFRRRRWFRRWSVQRRRLWPRLRRLGPRHVRSR